MKKINYLLLVFITIFTCFLAVNAKITTMPTATVTDYMRSSILEDEYYIVRTPLDEDNVIYVEGKTKIPTYRFCIRLAKHKKSGYYPITVFVTPNDNGEFSVRIDTSIGNTDEPEIYNDKGSIYPAYVRGDMPDGTYNSRPGHKAVEQMEEGIYHLTIARATTVEDAALSQGSFSDALKGNDGYANKEFLLQVTGANNNPKLITYTSVVNNNNIIQNKYESRTGMIPEYDGSYVRYLDKYMKDISFVFTNPKTGTVTAMNDSRVSYLTKVSNNTVAGITNDYDKVLKIYEYVASNFYYDRYAYEQKKYHFSNPYLNIYNQKNKKASDNSNSSGNVAVTCQGFASMIVALARMQGIPARLVQGHHISLPLTIYQDKSASDLSTNTHWWAEVYIRGRWVIVDANVGTNAKWERESFTEEGTWENKGLVTYAGFDPTMEVLSNSYIYNSIYKGSTANKFLANNFEVNTLKTFLNKKQSTKTNGQLLNSNYNQNNISTWGTSSIFMTNGYGKLENFLAHDKNLWGILDLSNFTALKSVSVYNNKLTALRVKNCLSLTKLYASYNKISAFDGSTAKKLELINLLGNKLSKATFVDKSNTITVKRNLTVGGFGLKYNKAAKYRLTIQAVAAPKGYKYLGIYNGSGKRLTTKTSYSFNPTGTSYVVKYKKL